MLCKIQRDPLSGSATILEKHGGAHPPAWARAEGVV